MLKFQQIKFSTFINFAILVIILKFLMTLTLKIYKIYEFTLNSKI